MSAAPPPVIYVDARPLQDPAYRLRGIGRHASSMIEGLRRHAWPGRRPRLVAVLDAARGALPPEHHGLFDVVTSRVRRDVKLETQSGARAWFLSLSPVTHDPVRVAAFLNDSGLFKVALFYDLIPLRYADVHLSSPGSRMAYVVALAWLRRFDAFAAISRFTADELITRMGVAPERVFVSGVAVRRSLEPAPHEVTQPYADRRWIVVSGGGDPRKNPECAIVAHAHAASLRRTGVTLRIFGDYPEAMRADFRRLHAQQGGAAHELHFSPHLTDDQLHQLYRGGLATVVPSIAEGFSIPIVESSAAGTPVLASDIDAHPELVRDPAWRFDPQAPHELARLFDRLVEEPQAWSALQDAQAALWREYTVERVSENFLQGVLARAPQGAPAPSVRRRARPRLAVLTPLRPAHSGVADYSANTLRHLTNVADVHIFTSVPGARWEHDWASLQRVSAAAYAPEPFDAVVCVAGNSPYHVEIVEHLTTYGGACIAHDARMTEFYALVKGAEKAVEVASQELGRPITVSEIEQWLQHPRDLPIMFFSELAAAGEPLFVHSPETARKIRRLYSVDPVTLPFAQQRTLGLDQLQPDARAAARRALDVGPETVLISSFGGMSEDKAVEVLIWSLGLLHQWGVPALLAFCGKCSDGARDFSKELAPLMDQLGLRDHVRMFDAELSEAAYRSYLSASDVGVQLRTQKFGQVSGALNDCIFAALPSIANESLAEAMLAPSLVRRTPDNLSAVLVAEAVLEILDSSDNRRRPVEMVTDYRRTHSQEAYCDALLSGLGFDLRVTRAG